MSTFVARFDAVLMLDTIIISKTRLSLLVKFFINTSNRRRMGGLTEEFNESTNATHLNNLSEAGYLRNEVQQNRLPYQTNIKYPLFEPLQNIANKYLGLDTIVTKVLDRMEDVMQVVLTGDYAEGGDGSTIDITTVGPLLNTSYLAQLAPKVERMIQSEVRFTPSSRKLSARLILHERRDRC